MNFAVYTSYMPSRRLRRLDKPLVVHSRGSWKVRGVSYGAGNIDEEALEMLVNGMRHESKHCPPTGFITELTFYNIKLSISVAWLKELPWFVLFNLSVLILRHCRLCLKSFELLAQLS